MKTIITALVLLVCAYVVWPFTVLYQLDKALDAEDGQRLQQLVDLETIKNQIKQKMNKDVDSTIGDVSNEFVSWLQSGIQRLGANAIDELVDMDWVKLQLRSHNPVSTQGGYFDQMEYAFFDGVDSLLIRIGPLDEHPVHARLTRHDLSWRITAIYN